MFYASQYTNSQYSWESYAIKASTQYKFSNGGKDNGHGLPFIETLKKCNFHNLVQDAIKISCRIYGKGQGKW